MVKHDIERYRMERDKWNGNFTARDSLLLGKETTHEEYIVLVKYHAPTPENLARERKGELES